MADALVTMNQTILGKEVKNVLCFNNITEIASDLQDFADNIRSSWEFYVQAFMSDDWVLENITVSFLSTDTVDYSVDVNFTDGTLTGIEQSDVLPTTNALLVSTQYVGVAPNRGRIYFGGLTENNQSDSAWGAGGLFAFRDLVEFWRDGVSIGSGTAFLRILRRPSDVFPSYVSNPVDNVITRLRPATVRGRRLGTP